MIKRFAVLLALGAVFISGCYFRRTGNGNDGRTYNDGGSHREDTYSHNDRDRDADDQQRDREADEQRDGSRRGVGLFFWR
jgi:hypothetical protein